MPYDYSIDRSTKILMPKCITDLPVDLMFVVIFQYGAFESSKSGRENKSDVIFQFIMCSHSSGKNEDEKR